MSDSDACAPSPHGQAGASSSDSGRMNGASRWRDGDTSARSSCGSSTVPRTLTRYGPPLRPSPQFVQQIRTLAELVSEGLMEPREMGRQIETRLRRRELFWRLVPVVVTAAPLLIGLMLTLIER